MTTNGYEEDHDSAHVTYTWETDFRGTLHRDDPAAIEELVSEPEKAMKWSLSGDRELGSAAVTASTLRELIANRLEIGRPASLSFEAGKHYALRQPGDIRFELSERGRYDRDPAFTVAITGYGVATRDRFDRIVRGLQELRERIEARGTRPWLQRHPEQANWLLRSLTVGMYLLWGVFVTAGWAWLTPFNVPHEVTLVNIPVAFTWIALWRLKLRVQRLIRWRPGGALFDLTTDSSSAVPENHPELIARDTLFWLASTALALLLWGIALWGIALG